MEKVKVYPIAHEWYDGRHDVMVMRGSGRLYTMDRCQELLATGNLPNPRIRFDEAREVLPVCIRDGEYIPGLDPHPFV